MLYHTTLWFTISVPMNGNHRLGPTKVTRRLLAGIIASSPVGTVLGALTGCDSVIELGYIQNLHQYCYTDQFSLKGCSSSQRC